MVGVSAAVERDKSLPRLQEHGLASPDWDASRKFVARHYPAGTEAAGIWLRREGGEDKEKVEALITLLIESTGLKVRLSSLVNSVY